MLEWFRKRRDARRQFERDIALSEVVPRLHGVNLTEWRYLGRTVISFVDHDNLPTAKATLFAFCGMDDTDDRHFVLIPHQEQNRWVNFENHTYVMEHAALWEIGERNLWDIVGAEPSRWLREHMFGTHGMTWDANASWWINGLEAPKSLPKPKKGARLMLVETSTDENNVVRVRFGKKNMEESDA